MAQVNFNQFQHECVSRIESSLNLTLPSESDLPYKLHAAMRYSTLDGGKRIRAQLVYATGQLLKINTTTLDPIACAVELIHAYSLIHDDLPTMDDDDLRRGKPSCHKAFDDAIAILAGDALQTLAFKTLTKMDAPAERKIACIEILSEASGSLGMVGGQAIDLASSHDKSSLEHLERMHKLKTGAVIKACITMPASLVLEQQSEQYQQLNEYADCIGLAFQVQDDILDETASSEALGKTKGKDKEAAKATYLSVLGLEKSQILASELNKKALQSLSQFDLHADTLRDIANFTISRCA